MAFEGKAINFLTSFSSINLFSTTMCTTCEGMASFRPLAFELEAKEIYYSVPFLACKMAAAVHTRMSKN